MSTCSYELVPKFDSAKSFYGKAIVENQTDGFALESRCVSGNISIAGKK